MKEIIVLPFMLLGILVIIFLFWSKLLFVGIDDEKFLSWGSLIFLTEAVLENLPQFFIQIINNNKSDGWDLFEAGSILLTAGFLIYELINQSFKARVYYCPPENGQTVPDNPLNLR